MSASVTDDKSIHSAQQLVVKKLCGLSCRTYAHYCSATYNLQHNFPSMDPAQLKACHEDCAICKEPMKVRYQIFVVHVLSHNPLSARKSSAAACTDLLPSQHEDSHTRKPHKVKSSLFSQLLTLRSFAGLLCESWHSGVMQQLLKQLPEQSLHHPACSAAYVRQVL